MLLSKRTLYFIILVCVSAWTVFANAIGTNTMPLEDPEGDLGRGIFFKLLTFKRRS